MISRTASGNVYTAVAFNVGFGQVHTVKHNFTTIVNTGRNGVVQGTGLFHNFFFHKVIVAVFFGRLYVPSDFFGLFDYRFQIAVKHPYLVAGELYNFTFAQVVNFAGVRKNSGNVGSHKVALVRKPHNQGGGMTYRNKTVLVLVANDTQSIRAF